MIPGIFQSDCLFSIYFLYNLLMTRLGCRCVAESVLENVRKETQAFIDKGNKAPSLAVVLVGSDPASQTYVRKKAEAAESLGFLHFQYTFDEDSKEDDILSLVGKLNESEDVDGILVQLPLPSHISEKKVIDAISPEKDVDGFSPVNMGRLAIGEESFIPCTPKGIMRTLSYYGIETAGKKAVVIGRSNIVGKPMALLLMQKGIDATVTVCNTKTPDLREYTKDADIIIVATGHPETIDSSYVKDGAAVIDVGVNRIKDETREKGFRLVGDADYSSFKDRDVMITPVPGGVGLMTVSMLMENTLEAAVKRRGR